MLPPELNELDTHSDALVNLSDRFDRNEKKET